MSLLFITKLKTWMFLSYVCHSLIQDNVFHIFTLTALSTVLLKLHVGLGSTTLTRI